MAGKRFNVTDVEAHDLVRLLMAEIERLSASGEDPERLRRLRSLLERLSG